MIGIVCGLKSEAEALAPLAAQGFRIRVSGASAARARALAEGLAAEGAEALLSVGLAGGLAPELASGALLLPEAVRLPDGALLAADGALLGRLAAALGRASGAVVAGADAAVLNPEAKQALAAAGAAIVDMETHGVALAAKAAGLPWAAVRAVADDSRTALPRWAMGLVQPDGAIDDARAALALLRAPWTLPLALKLAGANARALAALRGAAAGMLRSAPAQDS